MDTNICLYCENPLEETSEYIGFCSTQCHSKETLKTKIPTWPVLHSIHRRVHQLPFITISRTSKPIPEDPLAAPSTQNIYIPSLHYCQKKCPTSSSGSMPIKNLTHLYLLSTKL
ncbi:hypothetical protein BCR42DRAFT_427532 [Absidia repens]|uniref:Uncharacterized protein n=1 Tax=Absidia repens TaxID=90262 RepID=A0A1X2HZK7_9FUNG|nr:hypothetical protein BCR42DRAFT_427532 [Absidia repens]